MHRLRVAIAGAGMASAHHLIAWSRCADATVVAIADPNAARAKERAVRFNIAAFGDVDSMLDAVCPDALDIAASHTAHEALCEAAARRGIAILCQKPLAPSLEDARRIAASVARRVRLMVHENWRHRPYYRQVRDWLAADAIGSLRHVVISARGSGLVPGPNGSYPSIERQPMLASLERLMIGEVLVHHLDVAAWLVGPLTVRGACSRRDVAAVRGESAATILLQAAGGCSVVVDGDLAVPLAPARVDDRLEILGSSGTIRLDDTVLRRSGAGPSQQMSFDVDLAYQQAYDATIAHFAHALRNDLPFETPAEVHLGILELVEDAYRAAASSCAANLSRAGFPRS